MTDLVSTASLDHPRRRTLLRTAYDHHLDENGSMAIVLPHGVLFRGAAEGTSVSTD